MYMQTVFADMKMFAAILAVVLWAATGHAAEAPAVPTNTGAPVLAGPELPGDFSGPHFKAADANADGKISEEEFHQAAQKRFEAADANKDGFVTSDEARQSRSKARDKMRELRQKRQAQ